MRARARAHARTHSVGRGGDGQGCEKHLVKIIIIKHVRLEGGFERGRRIRVAECLRQIVPDRWASIRKKVFHQKCFCVYTGGDKGSCVRPCADRNCLAGV